MGDQYFFGGFRRPLDKEITERQVLKTQWIQSSENCVPLHLKMWIRRSKNRSEQSWYTLKV